MTFDEFFAEHTLTEQERVALVWHLAEFRARRTVEELLNGVLLPRRPTLEMQEAFEHRSMLRASFADCYAAMVKAWKEPHHAQP